MCIRDSDIADVLGAKEKKDGYIEGNGYQVTWTCLLYTSGAKASMSIPAAVPARRYSKPSARV